MLLTFILIFIDQLAVNRIFTIIEKNPERAFLLRCSYIEIYNETISDLLSANHQKLKVQELAEGHVRTNFCICSIFYIGNNLVRMYF